MSEEISATAISVIAAARTATHLVTRRQQIRGSGSPTSMSIIR